MEDLDNESFDIESPALSQVYHMKNYPNWNNVPLSNLHESYSISLFSKNPYNLLEMSSKSPVWLPPLFWIPFSFSLFYFGSSFTFSNSCVWWVGFTVLWPLLEYCLHRFIFHISVEYFNSAYLNCFQFLVHGIHHKHPKDRLRIISPFLMSCVIALIVVPPTLYIFEKETAFSLLSGLTMGYITYDLIHFYLHFGKPRTLNPYYFEPWRSWLIELQKKHHEHHFTKDGHTHTFGVSHDVWDFIFWTISPKIKRI